MKNRIDELVQWLNDRTKEYDAGVPTVTDKEFDDKYFELIQLENLTNYINPESPTQKIIYQVVSQLNKISHNHPMLSLDKTKDLDVIRAFLGKVHPWIAMLKMDGLTCSLKYSHGRLVSAETRGNGYIGEDITHNAYVIENIPKTINYYEDLIIDGEMICDTETFNTYFAENYKNPRNFAAGSIRLLDAKECARRKLKFVAWEVIHGFDECITLEEKFTNINSLGFETVPFITTMDIDLLINVANERHYPIDGIVFKFNDIEYGKSLGSTEHHFKNAIAYKLYDEIVETYLRDIEWGAGRSDILTPVAIFDPVEIDGSVIERASLHNISIMKELLGENSQIGQPIRVFKANMIIPQVYDSDKNCAIIQDLVLDIPAKCPVCGEPTDIRDNDGVKNLICTNSACGARLVNRLDHFCGKKGLDIKGLSKATLEKVIDWGWVENAIDIFHLHEHREEWIKKPGFGVASVDKILNAIEAAKDTTNEAFISALGIPLIGQAVAKDLMKHFDSYDDFRRAVANHYDFSEIDGFAESKTEAIWKFDFTQGDLIYPLLRVVHSDHGTEGTVMSCAGSTIVITGKLSLYKNREALKAAIEAHGGKVVDSVSKNTTILINNDVESTSSKNKRAKELGIPIFSEEKFNEMYLMS